VRGTQCVLGLQIGGWAMRWQGRALVSAIFGAITVLWIAGAEPAHAATYTVTTTADPVTTVQTCGDDGCTLRAALLFAASGAGGNTVEFNIPGSGVKTITPYKPLPYLRAPVLIDGTTQPSFRGTPVIEIDGTVASAAAPTTEPKHGLVIVGSASNVVIQGLVINRWAGSGIWVEGSGNRIVGNFIGTDPTGTQARPNATGISLFRGGTTVGGHFPAERNVISGNTASGVYVATTGTTSIHGNFIGTDASGNGRVGNGGAGVSAVNATNLGIGGPSPEYRNVIAANGGSGIDIAGGDAYGITNNHIGVGADRVTPLGNTGDGINLGGFVQNAYVGFAVPGLVQTRNVIAHNSGAGIRLRNDSSGAGNNRFRGNEIRQNGGLGIDIGPAGVTPNDPGDGDTGPNGLQNFPILLSAGSGGQTMTVTGTLDSTPGTYEIDFFLVPTGGCDSSGYGEAHSPLGRVEVAVSRGPVQFQASLPPAAINQFVTATATRLDPNNPTTRGSTSELSPCLRIDLRWITVTAPSQTATTTEAGGQGSFTVVLTSHPTSNVIIGISSADTTEGTVSPATLTFTPQNGTTPQTVTVKGVDDTIDDGNVQYIIVTAPAQSADPGYNGFNPLDPTMTNIDND
jgi:trimeric autotransporter adhesin